MKIGYVRVSTQEQNTARQDYLMKSLKCDKIFLDRVSGKNTDREQLKEMLSFVRNGDIVIVESISRFARNTKDLLELIEKLNNKNVKFISVKENIDTNTATGKFMLTVFGAVSELEREYIKQRQFEGIQIAKKNKDKYKGRKKISYNEELFEKLYKVWKNDELSTKEFMNKVQLKPNTFYRRIKSYYN